MLHMGERVFFTRVLSAHDSTALTIEDTCTPGIIRVRVESADVEIAVLLDPSEAEWLRDKLVEAIADTGTPRTDTAAN